MRASDFDPPLRQEYTLFVNGKPTLRSTNYPELDDYRSHAQFKQAQSKLPRLDIEILPSSQEKTSQHTLVINGTPFLTGTMSELAPYETQARKLNYKVEIR